MFTSRIHRKLVSRVAQASTQRSFSAVTTTPLNVPLPDIPLPIGPPEGALPDVQITKLDNGLTVATRDTHEPTAFVGAFINAGSRYEDNDNQGHAHFIERMGFRSTKESTSFSIDQALEHAGANVSAHADRELMIFQLEGLRKFTDDYLNILADTVINPAFHIHEVNNTKYEYVQLLENADKTMPDVIMQENTHEAAYGRTGLGLSLYASRRVLDTAITPASLREYVNKFFVPNQMLLCGLGVEHNEFVSQVSNYFGAMERKDVPKPEKSRYIGRDFRVHDGDPQNNTHLLIAFESESWNSDDYVPMNVLQMLMGGGSSFSAGGPGKGMHSNLYLNVLNKHHFVQSCDSLIMPHSDTGLFGVHAVADNKHAKDLCAVVVKELKDMADPSRLDDEAFARAKKRFRTQLFMNLESRAIVFDDMGRQVLGYGKVHSAEEWAAKIDAVTKDDLIRVATKMLKTSPTIVVRGDNSQVPYHPELAAYFAQ